MTMPGLPLHPAAERIDVTDDGVIVGLSQAVAVYGNTGKRSLLLRKIGRTIHVQKEEQIQKEEQMKETPEPVLPEQAFLSDDHERMIRNFLQSLSQTFFIAYTQFPLNLDSQ